MGISFIITSLPTVFGGERHRADWNLFYDMALYTGKDFDGKDIVFGLISGITSALLLYAMKMDDVCKFAINLILNMIDIN